MKISRERKMIAALGVFTAVLSFFLPCHVIRLTLHYLTNEELRNFFFSMPIVFGAAYHFGYRLEHEGWKIKEKFVNFFYDTPFDKGWVKERFYGQTD